MPCIYTVHLLPITSIVSNMHPQKRERNYLKIKERTFFSIHSALRIRPKAAIYSILSHCRYQLPVYAVTYQDSQNTECLFVFTFRPYVYREGFRLELVRCVGRRVVKKHWEKVILFLYENEYSIRNLSSNQCVSFI